MFYVASDADGTWIVVDGLQRLTALNQFIREKAFALEKLEFLNQFNGLRFDDLPRPMQRRILESEPSSTSSNPAVRRASLKPSSSVSIPAGCRCRPRRSAMPCTKAL